MKTIKLKFDKDMFYGDKCVFQAGKVYDVETENGWADRWLKRGSVEVIQPEVVAEEKKEQAPKNNKKQKSADAESEL